jgi:hypothetical protein
VIFISYGGKNRLEVGAEVAIFIVLKRESRNVCVSFMTSPVAWFFDLFECRNDVGKEFREEIN